MDVTEHSSSRGCGNHEKSFFLKNITDRWPHLLHPESMAMFMLKLTLSRAAPHQSLSLWEDGVLMLAHCCGMKGSSNGDCDLRTGHQPCGNVIRTVA